MYFDDFKVEHVKSPVISSQSYYPFGLTFGDFNRENSLSNQYQYNGKELQDELNLGWLDYGWRMYQSEIGRWNGIDMKADKFTTVSPYTYAINNPVIIVDPNGKDVKPTNEGAYKAILNTLSADDQAYVKLDKNGMIDKSLLNGHSSESGNFNSLRSLVNSERITEVTVSNEYQYKDADGNIQTGKIGATYSNELEEAASLMPGSSKEQLKEMGFKDESVASGVLGITLLPGGEKDADGDGKGSANGNITVILSSDLKERDAARTQSHEGNGHALFSVLGKDPNHSDSRMQGGNKPLEDQIKKSVKETEKNYDDAHKKK